MENNNFDHDGSLFGAMFNTSLSIASVVLAWISLGSVQVWITFGASIMAGISAYMAARYYYYATKEKKKNIDK